jgi:hypothetical protein
MNYSLGNMLSRGGALNPYGLSLDLAFAADKTLTARKGPTPTFTRASTATFVGSNGLIQSAAINAPRFDHDPVTLACKGLLIEESRTNFVNRSESIANPYWNAFATATAVDNITTSPIGLSNSASRMTAISGISNQRQRVAVFTLTSGSSARTASVFLKADNNGFGFLSLDFNKSGVGTVRSSQVRLNLSNGSAVQTGTITGFSYIVTPYTNGWYRVAISATSAASLTVEDQVVIIFGLSFDASGASGTFTGTETVYVWGAQLEEGLFPTSYIPTAAASVVRSADVCSITGSDFTGIYNGLEGTIISDGSIASIAGNNRGMWAINNNTSAHGFLTYYDVTAAGISSQSRNTGSTTLTPNFLNSANTLFKRALAYRTGQASICTNGSSVTTTNVTISTQTMLTLQVGNMLAGSFYWSGHIARIQYFKKRLPDAKLQSLTTP